jgi:4-aminobutyrate aminotransferase-like enzyme
MTRRGVLIGKGSLYGNVIRTGLMLNVGKTEVDEMVDAIGARLTVATEVAKDARTSDAKSA